MVRPSSGQKIFRRLVSFTGPPLTRSSIWSVSRGISVPRGPREDAPDATGIGVFVRSILRAALATFDRFVFARLPCFANALLVCFFIAASVAAASVAPPAYPFSFAPLLGLLPGPSRPLPFSVRPATTFNTEFTAFTSLFGYFILGCRPPAAS